MAAPGRPVAPAPLRARLLPTRVHLPPLLPPISSHHASSSRARTRARLRHRPHKRLAGVGHSSHHSSPPAPPSCCEHRLHLTHSVLALARHGKATICGNRSSEPQPSSSKSPAPWTPPLRPLFVPSLTRIITALISWTSLAPPRTSPWSGLPSQRQAAPPPLPWPPPSLLRSANGSVL
jgi:hypothetical protein